MRLVLDSVRLASVSENTLIDANTRVYSPQCVALEVSGWRKGGGDAWMGAQKCVTVKIFVPHKKNQKKCSDSWQRRGGV